MPTSTAVTIGTVWFNGNSLAGQVKTVEFPELEREREEQNGLGHGGVIAYPTTLKELELKLDFTDFSPDGQAAAMNHKSIQTVAVYFNVQETDGVGVPNDKPLAVFCQGRFYNCTLGKFEHGKPMEGMAKMTVYKYRYRYANGPDTEVDLLSGTHVIRGNDITAIERRNAQL